MKTTAHKKLITVLAVTGFFAAFFIVLIVVYRWEEKKRIDSESIALLNAFSESKQALITNWLIEEVSDVKLIIESANLIDVTSRFVEGKSDESPVVAVFDQIKSEHGYAELVLLSETGDYLMSTNQALTFNDSIDQHMLFKALSSDSSYVSDIYRSSIDHHVYIDLVSIVRNAYGKAFGGLIFKIDAEKTVDQMLSDLHMGGYQGLASLVQQQPDKKWIVYKPDSSLVSEPSCWKPLPAHFKNNPFRSHNPLTRVMPLPNSPWSLLVELDNSRRKANSNASASLLIIIGVVSVLLFFIGVYGLATFQEKKQLEKLKERVLDLNRVRNQFWFTLDMLSEAIVLTDHKGMIQYINLAAELLIGSKQEEILGTPIDKHITLLQEESGMPLLSVKNWFSGEGAYNQHIAALFVNKSGSHIRVLCSIAPLKGDDSESRGLVVVLVKDDNKQDTPDSIGEKGYKTN